MLTFKNWFLSEIKDEIHPVHPEIKKWVGSVEKLKKDLETLKATLKNKKIDVTKDKVEEEPVKEPEEKKPEKDKEPIEPKKPEKPKEKKSEVKKPEPKKKPEPFVPNFSHTKIPPKKDDEHATKIMPWHTKVKKDKERLNKDEPRD